MNKDTKINNIDDCFFSKTYEFLNVYLIRQLNKSIHTRKSYKEGLSSFYDFITNIKNIDPTKFKYSDCTYEFLLEYLQYLRETLNLKNSTINSRITSIKSYIKYISDIDIAFFSIYLSIQKIPFMPITKDRKEIIRQDDLKLILSLPKDSIHAKRDQLILILLFDSAIRVSELVNIKIGDIIIDNGLYSIIIHGKGRKERCITLSEKASVHLKNYLDEFKENKQNPSTPLIYSKIKGNIASMTTRNIAKIVKKYSDLARNSSENIPDSVYPHMIRRTRATLLYQDGVPLEQISALLGHESMETTRSHYAYPSPEQLRKAVEKGSPQVEQEAEWEGNLDEIKRRFGLK